MVVEGAIVDSGFVDSGGALFHQDYYEARDFFPSSKRDKPVIIATVSSRYVWSQEKRTADEIDGGKPNRKRIGSCV
ncbi:hypothetical protein KSP40_PGU019660 [Platanthera guangdongensis]|uniref:Uncharacterized protein n=1 Tax=Platanthera guangdongensis TaxID=2320717 RepID=A0ABR2MKT6_9ASPA